MQDNMTAERQPGQPEDPDGKLINTPESRIPLMSEDEIERWAEGVFDRLR